ncbi:MAG: ATP-binding cassette domain-containing protein [Rectinemataceae bacterium]|jgi:ABC-type multidrug transport system ATPase subunit
MSPAAIALEGFSVALPSGLLFSIPRLEIHEGDSVAIIGKTGAGKSVLLRSIAGLLPVSPFIVGGMAEVLGAPAYRDGIKAPFREWRSLREGGLVFMPPEPALVLNQALTLSQNLALFGEERSGRVEECLKSYFGIRWKEFEKRYPDEVSGGELQRISLMILLARRGRLILLDEPTVSLDADLRIAFVEFLNKELLTGGEGGGWSRTIVLASHDLDFVSRLSVHGSLRLEGGGLTAVLAAVPAADPVVRPPRRPVCEAGSLGLEIKKLSQSYTTRGVFGIRRKSVFKGLCARFGPSRVYSVLGPSGCGKTSFYKAVLRLVSDTEGSVLFDGADLVRLKPEEDGRDPAEFRGYRRRLGIVLQDSRFAFLPDRSVASTLRLVFRKAGMEPEPGLERAKSLLPRLGLEERHLGAKPLSLSSGESKRMDLLRVLCCDFDALLLDEPFAHIDFQTRLVVMGAVEEWLRSRERILIAVTHEEFDLLHFSDESLDFLSMQSQSHWL